jgi:hypothetical protein
MRKYLTPQKEEADEFMKKSKLKEIIHECIEEVIKEYQHVDTSGVPPEHGGQYNPTRVGANEHHSNRIISGERTKLSNAFHKYPELGGNKKLDSLGQGISIISKCLDELGYELDMVTGDILLGQSGTRNLSYRRKDRNGMSKEIENSRIVFTWTNLGDEFNKRYEIIAYPS